ncbi:MAG: hypothetical protein HY287_17870 [Planctomycetes bacterium]|nr:hypothetical protein [Planctomycetota bacterium]MBI3836192.1 hypothetical protein [Planctomycetota bacterium]
MKIPWPIRWIGGFVLLIAILAVLRMRSGSGLFKAIAEADRPMLRVGYLPVT